MLPTLKEPYPTHQMLSDFNEAKNKTELDLQESTQGNTGAGA